MDDEKRGSSVPGPEPDSGGLPEECAFPNCLRRRDGIGWGWIATC